MRSELSHSFLQKIELAIIKANKEIVEYLKNITSKDFEYSNKIGAGGDNSLNIDLEFEKIFIKHLLEFGSILSEEIGFVESKNKDLLFVVDPLDGSDNFVSGIPYFGTSVALKYKDEVVFGAVCNLATKELIIKNSYSFFSFDLEKSLKYKIQRRDFSKLAIFERAYSYPKIVEILKDNNIKFRSPGALALSICYAKDVEFVLFKGNIRDFDILAGVYICNDLHIVKEKDLLFITKNKKIINLLDKILYN